MLQGYQKYLSEYYVFDSDFKTEKMVSKMVTKIKTPLIDPRLFDQLYLPNGWFLDLTK